MDIHIILSVFHLVLVVPLFLFVGYQRADTPRWVYLSLLTIGCVVGVYHGIRFIQRYQTGSSSLWVNAIHLFLVAPLLCFIGWNGRDTPRSAYELILLAGFSALGYHLFQLVKAIEAYPETVEPVRRPTHRGEDMLFRMG